MRRIREVAIGLKAALRPISKRDGRAYKVSYGKQANCAPALGAGTGRPDPLTLTGADGSSRGGQPPGGLPELVNGLDL